MLKNQFFKISGLLVTYLIKSSFDIWLKNQFLKKVKFTIYYFEFNKKKARNEIWSSPNP